MPTAGSASITGFVLAGGSSRRMGQDKAFLNFRGYPLIEWIAKVVEGTAGSAIIIGDPERYSALNRIVIPDRRIDCGPLAGIEAGLMYSTTEKNLFVACDMPNLRKELLHSLIQEPSGLCVMPKTPDGQLHPLCAVWSKQLLPQISASLDANRLRVLSCLQSTDIKEVHWETLSNTNTPEEWRAHISRRTPPIGA